MNQILGIFLPAILAIHIYEKFRKQELELKEWIIKYLIFVLFINIVSFAITIYIFNQVDFIFTNLFTLKYALLGVVLGIIISIVSSFIEKNMELDIRIDNNEK